MSAAASDGAAAPPASQWIRLSEAGRVVIPVEMREALGLAVGDKLFLKLDEYGLHVMTFAGAMQHLRDLVAPQLPVNRSLADELIAERRAEAARE